VDASGIGNGTYVSIEITNCLVSDKDMGGARRYDCLPQGLPDNFSFEGLATESFSAERLDLEAGGESDCSDLVLDFLWRVAIDLLLHFLTDSLRLL